ncbi:MAG: tyrosine-type recombinase/integrase [Duncaniella sp.]|nr:tyrosine-type recombinase/integrase [Duncaniella sp.]
MEKFQPKIYLRKDKSDKNGCMPMYISFPRVNGEEPRFSLGRGRRLSLDEWDEVKQLPKEENFRIEIEEELMRIKREIHMCKLSKKTITKSALREIVKGYSLANPENNSFFQYFDDFLVSKEKVDKIRMSSIKGYITTKNALQKFEPKLRIKDITVEKMNKFVAYMRRQGIDHGKGEVSQSIRNRLTHICAVIRYINAKGIELKNPFGKGGVIIPPAKRSDVFLTDKELGRLVRLYLNGHLNKTEHRVLTMYLFSCATGMRISDVKGLEWRSLGLDKDVLTFLCKKTKRKNYVPLTSFAEDMICEAPEGDLEKVDNGRKVFFRSFSPTTINNTLQKLANKAEIDKKITFHSARRTFATLCMIHNVEFYIIQRTMGHTPSNMTEIYCQWNADIADMAKEKLSFWNANHFLKAI